MLRSSHKKLYISCCSNGELERLISLLSIDESLLKFYNDYGNKNGLYYSIRNLKYNVTDYLLSKGLLIDGSQVRSLISEWSASVESYIFLKKYNTSLYNNNTIDNNRLFGLYKSYCYSNNKVNNVIELYKYERLYSEETLNKIIQEYSNIKKNSGNKASISIIRDLKLKVLEM